MDEELFDEITGLVDDEITDRDRKEELLNLLKTNEDLRAEYRIQKDIKNLLQQRFSSSHAPAYLYESVMEQITKPPLHHINYSKSNSLRDFGNIIKKFFIPEYAVALLIIFSLVFSFVTPVAKETINSLIAQQKGEQNFWIQANSNFASIINGKLPLQFTGSNPSEIKSFFKKSGVNYTTEIPEAGFWELQGAVVSTEKNHKLAHWVYGDNSGHLVYLFQVKTEIIEEHKILDLSADMLDYINKGYIVKANINGHVNYIWSHDNSFFALVSNDNPDKIEHELLSKLK